MTTLEVKRIERRLVLIGVWLVACGTLLTLVSFGRFQAVSFVAGGMLGLINHLWLRRLVESLVLEDSRSSKRRILKGYFLRLLLIPLTLYAMIRFLFLSTPAAVAGFAVFNCSVFVEGILEAFGHRP